MDTDWKQRSTPSRPCIDGKGVMGGTDRAMKCIKCGLENPDIASALCTSDHSGGLRKATTKDSRVQECVSCGRPMDFTVYFTACPYCGFNYRIQVSSVRSEERVSLKQILRMLLLTMSVVILLFCLVWAALL